MRWSSSLRAFLLAILVLVPWCTLVHRNELGRWDVQRSAMAAPDEFSYLLMARHFMHGGGLSLQAELGRDTFYPPGYPLLLAGWGQCFGLSTFTAHALNTILLSGCVLVVYFLSRRLLTLIALRGHRRFALSRDAAAWLALLITGIFATNWHVLDTSLVIMSEPAFMLVTFAWLALALRWPDWPSRPHQAAVLGFLAALAWSIRGAGIVCIAATLLVPILDWWRARQETLARAAAGARWQALTLVLGFPIVYQILLVIYAPEKSIFAGNNAANSYTQQLIHGLIVHADPKDPHPAWAAISGFLLNLRDLVMSHLDDLGESFVPWLRENPDYHFRDIIGKIFGLLALGGFAWHALQSLRTLATRKGTSHKSEGAPATDSAAQAASQPHAGIDFVLLYLLFYIALYLVWPFNYARFWSPILPVMLILAADAVIRLGAAASWLWPRPRYLPAGTLLALLLVLSAVEDATQLGNRARRLNYVSDALAGSVQAIIRTSPDPHRTIIAGLRQEELFVLAWYFSQAPGGAGYDIRIPLPHVAAQGGRGEHADALLVRCVDAAYVGENGGDGKDSARRLFFFCYFPGVDSHDTLASFARLRPDESATKIYQHWNIVSVWEIALKPAPTQGQTPLSPGPLGGGSRLVTGE